MSKQSIPLPRKEGDLAAILREIGKAIQKDNHAEGLAKANQVLSTAGLASFEQTRVLSQVADSEFRRGRFSEASSIYLQSASRSLEHPRLWVRPLLGHVMALLKQPNVDQALIMARHAIDVAEKKMAVFNEQVRHANHLVAQKNAVPIPLLPIRPSVVATRLGYLFLRDGEPEAAEELFNRALTVNPKGGCRARQGLAKIELARGRYTQALDWSVDSIRRGGFKAKTLSAWPILISARRQLGCWTIRESLIKGLNIAPAGVRARAVLSIVSELRRYDMRQWRQVAQQWVDLEGQAFPNIEKEIRKMMLSSAKLEPGETANKRMAANQLLKLAILGPRDWLEGAKELVRSSLLDGVVIDIDGLVTLAEARYGSDFTPKVVHSLALSCMMAKRHDLARTLLRRNVKGRKVGTPLWAKSVWALARMEGTLGNHVEAAAGYRQFTEAPGIPARFVLQAQLLWVQELMETGQADVILEAKSRMMALLNGVQNPETLMNFARQLQFGPEELRQWGQDLFRKGEALAIERFNAELHPAVAATILFKLARRQVVDFGQCESVVDMWEKLGDTKKDWLWSDASPFWEYLGQVFEAYVRTRRFEEAEEFAKAFLDDPATPAEGGVFIGIPYAQVLIRRGRFAEGRALCERMVQKAPRHALCAWGWYWMALTALRQGDGSKAKECARGIRAAQGLQVGLQDEWNLDARAALILADLDVARLDREVVNYSGSQLDKQKRQINADLDVVVQ